jgi:S-adenosylmethionine:tRNA ribosyltransferase-isomerase
VKLSDFDYILPPERIAQTPIEPRHNARLLVVDRSRSDLSHTTFWQVSDYLKPGDLLIVNQTRVIPARLQARKDTGGRAEVLLLRRENNTEWRAMVGGKNIKVGRRLQVENGPGAEVIADLGGPRRLVRFDEPIEPFLESAGEMPLPPYIHTQLQDPERYQTVYAAQQGSAAAPTAGLHFTPELITHLENRGVALCRVTLHVGLDTFAPVTEEDVVEHTIHTEWCEVTSEAASAINNARAAGGRIVAVGTTSVRTLETAARHAPEGDTVEPFCGATDLYILPGYQFKAVDAIITNFHLPRSTLVMMISAFMGRQLLLETYAEAICQEYRFYSFGDAMLIQ